MLISGEFGIFVQSTTDTVIYTLSSEQCARSRAVLVKEGREPTAGRGDVDLFFASVAREIEVDLMPSLKDPSCCSTAENIATM